MECLGFVRQAFRNSCLFLKGHRLRRSVELYVDLHFHCGNDKHYDVIYLNVAEAFSSEVHKAVLLFKYMSHVVYF